MEGPASRSTAGRFVRSGKDFSIPRRSRALVDRVKESTGVPREDEQRVVHFPVSGLYRCSIPSFPPVHSALHGNSRTLHAIQFNPRPSQALSVNLPSIFPLLFLSSPLLSSPLRAFKPLNANTAESSLLDNFRAKLSIIGSGVVARN